MLPQTMTQTTAIFLFGGWFHVLGFMTRTFAQVFFIYVERVITCFKDLYFVLLQDVAQQKISTFFQVSNCMFY